MGSASFLSRFAALVSSWTPCLRCQHLPLCASSQPSAPSSPLCSSVSLLFASPSSPRASSTPLSALPHLDQVSSITLDTASSLRPGSPSAVPCLLTPAAAPSCSCRGAVIVPVTLATASIKSSAHAYASLPPVADGLRLLSAGAPDPAPGSPLHVPESPTTTPCPRVPTSASLSPCVPTPPPSKDLTNSPSRSLVKPLHDQADASAARRPVFHTKILLRFPGQDNPIPTHNPLGPCLALIRILLQTLKMSPVPSLRLPRLTHQMFGPTSAFTTPFLAWPAIQRLACHLRCAPLLVPHGTG